MPPKYSSAITNGTLQYSSASAICYFGHQPSSKAPTLRKEKVELEQSMEKEIAVTTLEKKV